MYYWYRRAAPRPCCSVAWGGREGGGGRAGAVRGAATGNDELIRCAVLQTCVLLERSESSRGKTKWQGRQPESGEGGGRGSRSGESLKGEGVK
eukprot:gene9774-biopygen7082